MRSVMCFGDSNTHGTTPMADLEARGRYDAHVRWTGVLSRDLGPEWEVISEGLPGRTTVHPDPIQGPMIDGLSMLEPLLQTHRPLDWVVIMLGTNDLKARFGLPAIDIALGCRRLMQAVATSQAGPDGSAPRMLVVCPPPILETGCLAEIFAGGAATSLKLPEALAAAAATEGAAFFDAGNVVASDPLDGIHLSAAAHTHLGAAIAVQLVEAAGETTRPGPD